jgi:hypothetical protein
MGRLKTGGRIGRERLGSRGSCGGKSEMEARQWGAAQRRRQCSVTRARRTGTFLKPWKRRVGGWAE